MRRALRADDLPHEGLEAMTRKVYWNSDAQPYDGTLAHILYDIRCSDAGENLLMDAVTAQDIIEDSDGELTFDALVSPYARLERRMEILRGIMERTGDKVKPVAMQVTQPFKQRGVANVAAIFELSDGQTVSIYFHNPDTTPGKMAPTDEVISWKWLLNKKDITIVVAPERGADLNVREVARRIMRLAEKNSAAFQRANAKRAERMQTIADLKTEITQLESELKSAQNELEVAKLEWEEAQERAKAQAKAKPEQGKENDVSLTNEDVKLKETPEPLLKTDADVPEMSKSDIGNEDEAGSSATLGTPLSESKPEAVEDIPSAIDPADHEPDSDGTKKSVSEQTEFTEPSKPYDEYLSEANGDGFEAAKAFYKTELQGKIVKTVIGDVHLLGGNARKEIQYGAKDDNIKAALIPQVPVILKSGEYKGKSELYRNREDRYVAFHDFQKSLVVEDKEVTANVSVGERDDGQFQYTAYSLNHSGRKGWTKKETLRTPELLTGREGFTTDSVNQLLRTPGYEPGKEDCGEDDASDEIGAQTLDAVNDEGEGGWNIRILKVVDLKTGERLRELEDGDWDDEQQTAQADEQALIDAYIKALGEQAKHINASVAGIDWGGITDHASAMTEYERLSDASKGTALIAAEKEALNAAGINLYENRVSNALHDSPEFRVWIDAGKARSKAQDKLLDIAKEKLIEQGKAELAALPNNAPLADIASAVYHSRGINGNTLTPHIIRAIEAKNADVIWEWLRTLDNKATAEIFERATGIKLAKTRRDRKPQIDAWAGITPEQRAEKEAAEDAAWLADKRARTVKSTFAALDRMSVRNKDNTISSGHEYLLGQVAAGFDQAQSVKRGAALVYGLSNGGKLSYIKNKTFSNFIKAAIAYGGLRQALELVGADAPQTNAGENKADKIAAVNAAYAFASATDGFKLWLHESINQSAYSPFVTAKAMDEAAKRHHAVVEWDKPAPALDDAGHSVASLQAGLAVIEKQAADSATGLEFETATNIRKAIDALEDEDYSPSEEEIGGLFEADTVVMDSATESPTKALLASLRSFLRQQTLDAADSEPDYVGKIKRDGEIIGRIDIGDDGKAMVYVGAAGDKRVVFPSGRTAMYSDDDAALMVDALFATQEQTMSKPKVGAFGEIFHGFTNKPEAAIAKIMTEKRGEVPDAFVHPELGNIAFVYGDERMGLRHIEVKHPEMLAHIPEVLRTGRLVRDEKGLPRSYIVQDGEPSSVATIRLDWDGEQKTWLVTAFSDDVGKFGAQKNPDEPSKVISERPTHPATPFLGSPAVAGQEDATTSANASPEKSGNDGTDVPELIAAGFSRVPSVNNVYARSVQAGNKRFQFNVSVTDSGFHVRLSVTFSGGITGAKVDLGRTDTAAAAIALVAGEAEKRGAVETQATQAVQSDSQKDTARTLFQSVIDGTVPDILAPELADEMEAAYLPVQGDPEVEALFERAAAAYRDALLAATANLE